MNLAEAMIELAARRNARLLFRPEILPPIRVREPESDEVDVPRFRLEPEPDRIVLGLPTRGVISSPFGDRFHPIRKKLQLHAGIDIAAPAGTAVWATAAGRVIAAGNAGGYGLRVVIDHGNGRETRYAHLKSIGVAIGDQVEAGETIGQVGSTGLSTGPHVHFEVRVNGRPVAPGVE